MNIRALFLDVGGVLLTNGWDRLSRQEAAEQFHFDYAEMDRRHRGVFEAFEVGACGLDEYLDQVLFYESRPFSKEEFKKFMFSQSKPLPGMIDLMKALKEKYRLKVVAVSNESREINLHRIETFKLDSFIDFFISSCFVHVRKPDPVIFKMALDVSQVLPEQVVYIDDRSQLIDVAGEMGINGICHKDYQRTLEKLASFGLEI